MRFQWMTAAAAGFALAAASQPEIRTAYDVRMTAIDGKPLPFADYRGKVLLVVNTASQCGFTPQYAGLKQLQADYAARGFTVIGVPSGDFMNQEFGTNREIKQFCEAQFGINFPLTAKSSVTGTAAAPFYRWARAELGPENAPKWNFHKYLVGRDGRLVAAFPTRTDPDAPELRGAIEKALAASS